MLDRVERVIIASYYRTSYGHRLAGMLSGLTRARKASMRILMISDVYFPRVNGVSTSIQTVAREFVQKGHEVALIAPDYGRHEPEPFKIIRIPSRYLPLDPEDRILRPRRVAALGQELATEAFDIVHIHTPFVAHYSGLALSQRLNIPVVESYHTFFEQYLDKYIPFVPSAWLRFGARRFSAAQCADVDALAVPSYAMLEVLRSYGVKTPAEVIPTGVELDQFAEGKGERFRQQHGIEQQRPVLVHVGRLAFEKNVDFLVRVLMLVRCSVPNVLLVIAGEGPARSSLEGMVAREGLQQSVLFVGYLGREGPLEDCYCAGDAFVFASRTETQGLVLLEAMALGVPVVSTAVMGTREVLRADHGCLIAEDEEADFAEKAVQILLDCGLRQRLSAEAKRYAREWSAPLMAGRMLWFYRRVMDQAGRHPQHANDAPSE
jgi:1,2-diacylglycerol 3-alpha-glucosyltransferase